MKRLPLLLTGLLLLFVSCAPSLEDKGDKYMKQAEKTDNIGTKYNLQKNAYTMYLAAIKEQGDKASESLKSKYVGSIVIRMRNVGGEHTKGYEALEVIKLREEAKKFALSSKLQPKYADMYADYLMDYAKHLKENNNITKCFEILGFASQVATDKKEPEAKMAEVKAEYIKAKTQEAKDLLVEGVKNEDEEAILRADYFARVALYHDKENSGAKEVVKQTTKELIGTYTAYDKVFTPEEDGLDTTIYNKINKQRVFMGFSKFEKKRSTLTLEGTIVNFSYNPVRLRKELFTLVLENGTELKPTSASFNKKLLDVKKDAEIDFKFTKVTSAPKMLKYKNVEGDITSDKLFKF